MITSDGNTGPSGTSPTHLLCHGERTYREPCEIQADRKKNVTIWRKKCPLGKTDVVPGMHAHIVQ